MFLANVIFPAPSAAYISTIFFPIAAILALAAEILVFRRTQGPVLSTWRIAAVVLSLNVLSWILGLAISLLLPSGSGPHPTPSGVSIVQPGPYWNILALASYPFACLLSTLLEYLGLRVFNSFSGVPFQKPLRCVALANLLSYVVLGIAVAFFLGTQ